MDYSIYILDTETTGLDSRLYDVIEISLYRLKDNVQKTWLLKPTNPNNFEAGALRINGHKIEDLRHETKQGRELYGDPNKVIVEIENWLMEDGVPAEQRLAVGHNVSFDLERLEQLWIKCNSRDTYPFGRRYLDTMIIELFKDYCKGSFSDHYNLGSIIKKYGVKNDKAHSAGADTKATKEVFMKQVAFFKEMLVKYNE
jgi:DNA polymerase III epsilon subunit-like protein